MTDANSSTETEQTPQLKLRVELYHEPRDLERDHDRIEHNVERMTNHPYDRITALRIAGGREASSAYVTLTPGTWSDEEIESLIGSIAVQVEFSHYADNVRAKECEIEAILTEPEATPVEADATEKPIES